MSTFGEMRNNILSDLNRTAANDLTASCETEIRTAIAFYGKRRFSFLEGRATTETIAGQEYYVLPDDFREEDSLVITVNQYTYPLYLRQYETIETWFVDNRHQANPTDFSIYEEQIRLYPIPDRQYQLVLSYFKKLGALNSEGDTNAWMVEGEGLIRSRVEWTLFARKLRDYDAAQACKMLEQEELQQHEKLTRGRLMTGHTRKRAM